jgi:hypothetical protein
MDEVITVQDKYYTRCKEQAPWKDITWIVLLNSASGKNTKSALLIKG